MFFNTRAAKAGQLDRIATLYLAYKFLGALYFTYPIFYQFSQAAISPLHIGMFFSVIGIVGFIAEVPTGVIADKHGRKLSAVTGLGVLSAAPLIIFFGHTFWAYLIAAFFYGLGRALLSGALESLVYDHKNISKEMFRKVNALEITFGQAGILVSAGAGGVLFSIHQSLPFITEAAAGIVCLCIVALMTEEHKTGHITPAASHRQHFTQSMRHLFATPYLRVTVLMGTVFSVMLGMCIQFVNEAAMIEHGFQPQTRGFLISGAGVITLIILHFFILKFVKSDTARIIYITAGALVAYCFMSFSNVPLFLFGYLLWCCLNATSSFLRLMIHDRIPGSHRTTILSNFKAFAVFIGLGASTAIGLLVQQTGTPRSAYILFGAIACFVLLPCAFWLTAQLKKESVQPEQDLLSA